MPLFVVQYFGPSIECMLGIDLGRLFGYTLDSGPGTLLLNDDPGDHLLYCILKRSTQDDTFHARVIGRVVIRPNSFGAVEDGTRKTMPPLQWRNKVLCS